MDNKTRPMLAVPVEWNRLEGRYPFFVSPKIDGMRAIADEGRAMSRAWKELPNRYVQSQFWKFNPVIHGFDGELVVGSPSASDVFHVTSSAIRTETGKPEFRFLVFDLILDPTKPYHKRRDDLLALKASVPESAWPPWIRIVPQFLCEDRSGIEKIEAKFLEQGYEGVMVRSPYAPYKFGRSTAAQAYLLKLKRFQDGEAEILSVVELMRNLNEATTSIQGLTTRTSHKAGKVPGGMLGALNVRLLASHPEVHFSIGSGFDEATRRALWTQREALPGRIVKFKSQPYGVVDAPRFPIFLGFRDTWDM